MSLHTMVHDRVARNLLISGRWYCIPSPYVVLQLLRVQNTPLNHWPPYIWACLVFLRLQVSTRTGGQILTYIFAICQFLDLYCTPK